MPAQGQSVSLILEKEITPIPSSTRRILVQASYTNKTGKEEDVELPFKKYGRLVSKASNKDTKQTLIICKVLDAKVTQNLQAGNRNKIVKIESVDSTTWKVKVPKNATILLALECYCHERGFAYSVKEPLEYSDMRKKPKDAISACGNQMQMHILGEKQRFLPNIDITGNFEDNELTETLRQAIQNAFIVNIYRLIRTEIGDFQELVKNSEVKINKSKITQANLPELEAVLEITHKGKTYRFLAYSFTPNADSDKPTNLGSSAENQAEHGVFNLKCKMELRRVPLKAK
ncbi:hypothetical protein BKI52_34355 [marine bacterium AO1-C]|nr:hypothetical protein BKI52_34355 [marine bacterium AO1-C]